MSDDKRFLRKLKKGIKKTGNKKRRLHLKDLDADPGDFRLKGQEESKVWNEKRKKK